METSLDVIYWYKTALWNITCTGEQKEDSECEPNGGGSVSEMGTHQTLGPSCFQCCRALICFSVKRPTYIIVGIFVLAIVAWFAWAILRDKRLARDFEKVETGTTESEVVVTLGKPKRIEKCGEFMGQLTEAELKDCSKEYFYASPFAPLMPEYYVVRFDANSRVSRTVPYMSP
jgi:hypothetical protein